MKLVRFEHAALASLTLVVAMATGSSAGAAEDPLASNYMEPSQKAYWEKQVNKMDTQGDGKVTREGFVRYYADLWDRHVPPGKNAVSVRELADKWAAMENQNPLDPEYKVPIWRFQHVESIDVDHDGTVTREEFLTHMGTHWDEATKLAHASALTHDQAMATITNPLDPRYHQR